MVYVYGLLSSSSPWFMKWYLPITMEITIKHFWHVFIVVWIDSWLYVMKSCRLRQRSVKLDQFDDFDVTWIYLYGNHLWKSKSELKQTHFGAVVVRVRFYIRNTVVAFIRHVKFLWTHIYAVVVVLIKHLEVMTIIYVVKQNVKIFSTNVNQIFYS